MSKNFTVEEWAGLLAGRAMPGDILVNESMAAYLHRKFAEIEATAVPDGYAVVPIAVLTDAQSMLEAHSPGSGSVESYAAQDIAQAMAVRATLQQGVGPDNVDPGYADHIELIEKLGGTAKYGDVLTANEAILAYEVARLNASSRLPPLDPDMASILGRPNFRCHDLAIFLRARGQTIPPKAEAEQAAVIYWLLGLYLQHGETWWEEACKEVQVEQARQHAAENQSTGIDSEGGSHD